MRNRSGLNFPSSTERLAWFSAPSCKLSQHEIELCYIQPGNPQQNAYIERFNRTVRYDLLNQDLFSTIEEVQEKVTNWLWHYNNERPNMALGGITPRQKINDLTYNLST